MMMPDWCGWWWWWQQYLTNSVDIVDKDAGSDSAKVKWTWEPGSYSISIGCLLVEAWKSSKLDVPSLRHQLVSARFEMQSSGCSAVACIEMHGPVRHNWKIVLLNKVLKKDEEGAGPENSPLHPSNGIPSKVRHSAAGPRMADKEQCKCAALHTAHCTVKCRVAGAGPNSIGAPPRPTCLISRLELRCIPIPGGITPNSTTPICQKKPQVFGSGTVEIEFQWNCTDFWSDSGSCSHRSMQVLLLLITTEKYVERRALLNGWVIKVNKILNRAVHILCQPWKEGRHVLSNAWKEPPKICQQRGLNIFDKLVGGWGTQ